MNVSSARLLIVHHSEILPTRVESRCRRIPFLLSTPDCAELWGQGLKPKGRTMSLSQIPKEPKAVAAYYQQ